MATARAVSPAANTRESVVFVLVGRWDHDPDYDGPLRLPDGRAFVYEGHGLGFVFGTPNYVFTCAHVIEDREPLDVLVVQRASEGRLRAVDGLMWDSAVDVALLHTPSPFSVPPLPARRSHRVSLGEEAHFFTPMIRLLEDQRVFGMSLCLRRSMISSIQDRSTDPPPVPRRLQIVIDAIVPAGSSGSPLICSHGLLGGMVFAEQMRPETGYVVPTGLGWALPTGALFEAGDCFARREDLQDLQTALSSAEDEA